MSIKTYASSNKFLRLKNERYAQFNSVDPVRFKSLDKYLLSAPKTNPLRLLEQYIFWSSDDGILKRIHYRSSAAETFLSDVNENMIAFVNMSTNFWNVRNVCGILCGTMCRKHINLGDKNVAMEVEHGKTFRAVHPRLHCKMHILSKFTCFCSLFFPGKCVLHVGRWVNFHLGNFTFSRHKLCTHLCGGVKKKKMTPKNGACYSIRKWI